MTPDSDVIILCRRIMTSESGVIICLHSIKTSADLLKRKRFTHGTLCSKSRSNGKCYRQIFHEKKLCFKCLKVGTKKHKKYNSRNTFSSSKLVSECN